MNRDLDAARMAKKNEFYTRIEEIQEEMACYPGQFTGKSVYCNCDDFRFSNFVQYFLSNFRSLGLKALYSSGLSIDSDFAYRAYFEQNMSGSVQICSACDGDFLSPANQEWLRKADIIVTNPPFSLFREYVANLMANQKKFLIIGNINAVTYRDIFPLIQSNQIWLGASIHSGDRPFYIPDDYPQTAAGIGTDEAGRRYVRVKGVRWFTNLDHGVRHQPLVLTKQYRPDLYQKYDRYDALNIDRTADIPADYLGIMGVPITFLDKYCPEQFEILGDSRYHDGNPQADDINFIHGKLTYRRLLIRRIVVSVD